MGTRGVFGYIIGKKKYITYVHYDANMLYDILIRELYLLLNKFGSIEVLQTEFEKIKIVDDVDYPTIEDKEKCKYFTDLEMSSQTTNDWYCLLRGCQSSFINLLEAGYIKTQEEEYGYVVILDFDKKVLVASGDFEYKSLTMEEIMALEDMPTKTCDEITNELKERYETYIKKIQTIDDIIKQAHDLLINTEDENIKKKIKNILCDCESNKIKMKYQNNEFSIRLTDLKMLKMDEDDE